MHHINSTPSLPRPSFRKKIDLTLLPSWYKSCGPVQDLWPPWLLLFQEVPSENLDATHRNALLFKLAFFA